MKKTPTPDELKLWKAQLKDVVPLPQEKRVVKKAAVLKAPVDPRPQPFERRPYAAVPALPPQEFGRKELRHLKVDGRLDMHGMTVDEGYAALERFLHYAQERGFSVVLIITGKGALSAENTLRRQLPRWIAETPLGHLIASFQAPAKQQDGGQGACYLKVRKRSFTY